MSTVQGKQELLRKYFGYTSFRDGQEALIDAQLAGKDALGVMPTGGGKSLCYQLPALLLDGVTLVISPLISLMKDQVMALTAVGIPAAYLNTSLSSRQTDQVYENLRVGRYKILYVAPERLLSEKFIAAARELLIPLVAVDEAHCISQWGQDFRPSYLKIPAFLKKLPCHPAVSAFTATATPQVQQDIICLLELRDPLQVVTGFDRPNLRFEVISPKEKTRALIRLLTSQQGKNGIIYCATRKNVEKLCATLEKKGFSVTRYHAGLSAEERRKNQEDFIHDRKNVMVATNAFGMGIDKSNVAFVFHYNMPKSLEAYYQEAGRAGRDGSPARCVLLFSAADVQTARFLIQNAEENETLTAEDRERVYQQDMERLDQMVGYCKTTSCLRGYILGYFGQTHAERCENCGNCLARFTTRDVTREAQMVLSCVRRLKEQLGHAPVPTLVIQVLRGSTSQLIQSRKLDQLSTYGLMRKTPRSDIQALIDHLLADGYLFQSPKSRELSVTKKAGALLFHGERVTMRRRELTAEERSTKSRCRRTDSTLPTEAQMLFDMLRELRYEIARQEKVPAYVIFSDATLSEMAQRAPKDMGEFLSISGVGAIKAERYGNAFLKKIKEHQGGKQDE